MRAGGKCAVYLSRAHWNAAKEALIRYSNELDRKSEEFKTLWEAWRLLRVADNAKRFVIEVEGVESGGSITMCGKPLINEDACGSCDCCRAARKQLRQVLSDAQWVVATHENKLAPEAQRLAVTALQKALDWKFDPRTAELIARRAKKGEK